MAVEKNSFIVTFCAIICQP